MTEEKAKLTSLIELVGSAERGDLQSALRILSSNRVPFFVEIDPTHATQGQASNSQQITLPLPSAKTLCQVPYFDSQLAINFFDPSSSPSLFGTTQLQQVIHLHEVLVKDVTDKALALIRKQAIAPKKSNVQVTAPLPLLSKEIAAYLEQKGTEIKGKSLHEYTSALGTFLEVMGDIPVNELTTEKYGEFIKVLKLIPKNRSKNPKTRNKPLKQVLDLGLPGRDWGTIEKDHSRNTTFINWLKKRHQHLHIHPELPPDREMIKAKTQKETRMPFSNDQLSMMFESDKSLSYLNKCAYAHQVWIPLIGLYTGARLNEICQLFLDDIREDNGVHYISFNENHSTKSLKGKSVSDKSSERDIPIHSKLIELGFLEYVEKQRKLQQYKTGLKRLWPDLKYSKESGYGRTMSRWFNDGFRKELRIEAPQNFHCFRHTVLEQLNMVANVHTPRWIVDVYVGHSGEQVEGIKSYNQNKKVSKLLPVLDHIKYNIDWTRYKALLDKFK